MKTLTTAIVFGLTLASGSAAAASYGVDTDIERHYGNGLTFQPVTHYLDKERVVLDEAAYDRLNANSGTVYDADLYIGN